MYKSPSVAVDGIIIKNDKIVLIKRGDDPFKDRYALPGGFVDYGETVEDAVIREVKEETGLVVDVYDLLGVYSAKDRDPRSHVMSVVFIIKIISGKLMAGDDAKEVGWFDLLDLPSLAFDHSNIINDFVKREMCIREMG